VRVRVRTWVVWAPRVAAFAALFSVAASGGCDWFDEPSQANIPPETTMVTCPSEVTEGDDVSLEWSGSDLDGTVVAYQWTYDDTATGATSATSLTLEDVGAGTHRFEAAAVDDQGDVDASPAICEFTAGEPGGPVRRVVLAEFITNLPCVNCPYAEQALDEMISEYGADSLCIISYHDHVGPDPLWTPETLERIDLYRAAGGWEPQTAPIVIFDGDAGRAVVGATSAEDAAANCRIEIDHRRTILSPLTLRLSGTIGGGRGDVEMHVRVREALPAGDYVLRTVVIEDNVILPSHDFGFVARDILDDEPLTISAAGDSAVVARSFTVDPSWVIDNVDVISFVQNDATLEVLQANRLKTR
jgi:hypothetical protein